MPISPIKDIIEDLKQGRMVVLMDDEDRENEGDLVMAAEHVRADDINFMAKYGRGLICLTLTRERCTQLQLPLMVSNTHLNQTTNFTLSIEAAEGVTTGISAADRARTVQAAVKADARPSDISMPGHIFPLMAQRGGVLARAGHTEAGVDLPGLAGLEPASVICEIMNEDGSMSRLPELIPFAEEHGLKIGTIADLIHYRMESEATVQRKDEYIMPTDFGEFHAVSYHDDISGAVHLALTKGDIRASEPTLVRVHVQQTILDAFTDAHRSRSWTLNEALHHISEEGRGVAVILDQAAEPSVLLNLLERFSISGSVEAPRKPAIRDEMRSYGLGSQILADLGVGKMRVMGHAIKTPGMSGFGLEPVEYLETSHVDQQIKNKKQAG